MWKKSITIILALVLALYVPGISVVRAETEDPIVFSDPLLRQALQDAGADVNADSEITQGELSSLSGTLILDDLGITDLSGMQYATGIDALSLAGNQIRSIEPLLGLDLDTLDVSDNYLDLAEGGEDLADIETLEATGCSVVYAPQKDIPVSGVALNKTSLEVCPGDTQTLTAVVSPEDAADQTLFWTTSDETVLTVNDGALTAVSTGTATVRVATQDGNYVAECSVSVKASALETDVYVIDDGFLTNITKLTSPGQLKANLHNDLENLFIYDQEGLEFTNGSVGTGMTVQLVIGDTVRDTLTIIVNGDTNGDGMISIIDYTLVRLDILGILPLEGVYRKASDIDADGTLNVIDYTLQRLDILNLKPINGFTPDLPEVSDARIRAFLDIALAQQGKPYVWGAEGPNDFDCSGFVYYCLTQTGYSVYRATANTYSKWKSWQYVDRDSLQPGDLMFYIDEDDPSRIGHIGIYLGNGYHIHASSSYECIIICKIDGWYDETLSYGLRVWY